MDNREGNVKNLVEETVYCMNLKKRMTLRNVPQYISCSPVVVFVKSCVILKFNSKQFRQQCRFYDRSLLETPKMVLNSYLKNSQDIHTLSRHSYRLLLININIYVFDKHCLPVFWRFGTYNGDRSDSTDNGYAPDWNNKLLLEVNFQRMFQIFFCQHVNIRHIVRTMPHACISIRNYCQL